VPNTLAHVGFRALATRAVAPATDLKWNYLGCIVPDVPWMLQRLYGIVQATLAMSLCLILAFASLATEPGRAFSIVAGNAWLHLLLDTIEIKWANGVHLLAPFDWRLTSLGVLCRRASRYTSCPCSASRCSASDSSAIVPGRSALTSVADGSWACACR
jgi:hypothetical protein